MKQIDESTHVCSCPWNVKWSSEVDRLDWFNWRLYRWFGPFSLEISTARIS